MKEKNKLFIPYVITLIGTIMMFLLLVLPFTTATDEYAERLDRFADTEVYKGLSLTCADVKNVSLVDYARIYVAVGENFWKNEYAGWIYAGLIAARLIFFDSGNKSYSKKAYRYHNINDFYGDNRCYF